MRRKLLADGLVIALGRGAGISLALIINILLAGGLTKEDYGRYLLVSSLIIIFSVFGRFGLHRVLLREIAIDKSIIMNSRVLRATIAISFSAIAIAALALQLAINSFAILNTCADTLRLSALSICCLVVMSLHQIVTESLRGLGRIGVSTVLNGERTGPVLSLLFLLMIVAMKFFDPQQSLSLHRVISAYLLAQVLAAGVSFIVLSRLWLQMNFRCSDVRKENPEESLNGFAWRTMVKASGTVAVADMLAIFIGLGDVWIAGAFLREEDLANWVAVTQLVLIISAPLSMISMTVIPVIPKLYQAGKKAELQQVLQSSATVACFLSAPLLLILLLAPSWFLTLVLGEKYADASSILQIACVGKMILVWTGSSDFTLELTGNQQVLLVNNALSLVALSSVGTLFAYMFGVNGLAFAICIVTSSSNLIRCLLVRRFCGIWTFASMNFNDLARRV